MKPIVTLTLNPAIDGASEAVQVRPIHKVRTSKERFDPGGGGVNVSRVVMELGGPTQAFYLSGGATGPVLDALLRDKAVPVRRIAVAGDTRISHTVFETSTGLEYRFVPEGPLVSADELEASLAAIGSCEADYVVASGSLPRGAPEDFYVRVGERVRARGARFVLDTSGAALKRTLDAGGVHLCKPSLGELEKLVGRELKTAAAQEEAALDLTARGLVDILTVTMGHEGALLAKGGRVWRLPALEVEARSAVGAGDSFVAAMTLALAQGRKTREAFMMGMAAGTAAVLTPGTEMCRRADVERLYGEFEKLATSAGDWSGAR
ncbi:MAG: phosphofructokinase [Hyphomicrobiales bacterium]|nr:phosphofructokinase [Hyphomicrobiales bacterium]